MKKNILNLLLILVLCLFIVGCGGKKPLDPEEPNQNYEINLQEESIILYVGDTYEIKPTVEGLATAEFDFILNDETKISIEGNIISALKAGDTSVEIILKDYEDIKTTLIITVKEVPVIKITGPTEVYVGEQIILEVELIGIEGNVIWTVDADDIAYVEDGVVEGIEEGIVEVTATYGEFFETYIVEVKEKPVLRINGKKSVEVGKTLQLSASTKNVDGEVQWSSSDESIATIDQEGLLTAIEGGTVEITISYKGFTATTEISILVPTLTLTGPEKVYVGETAKFTALLQNTLESYTIDWSTSEEEVAKISSSGVLTGVSEGIIKVIVTAAGARMELEVEVVLRRELNLLGKSSIDLGDTIELTPSLLNISGDIIWSSSDETIATVNQEGIVTSHALGQVTISATCEGITGIKEIEVVPMPNKITYNYDGGASTELYISEDDKLIIRANNNTNYWGDYASSIFLFPKELAINATFSDRISIGKDQYTGYWQILDICPSGTAVYPVGTEYVIVISNSYKDFYNEHLKVEKMSVGDYVFFEKDPAKVSSTNHSDIYFCTPEIKAETLFVLKEDYQGTLITPSKLGYEFLGWYDNNNQKVEHLLKDQIIGNVILNAKWNELNPVTDIDINTIPTEMETEDTFKINASVIPNNAFFKEIIFSTSNKDIISVTTDGLLTAVNSGKATITVRDFMSKIVKTYEIIVYSKPSIEITFPTNYNGVLDINDTLQLEPTYLGKVVDEITYTYASADPTIATVDASGLIKAIANGTVEITITSSSNKKLVIGLTIAGLTEEDKVDQVIKLIAENNFAEVEVGNACLYNDGRNRYYKATYGSINRYLFDSLDINRDYASIAENNPNGHRDRRFTGGFNDSIEFVTVHDTATLSGTTEAIASNMAEGETSIHYAVGNYEVYEVVPEKYIAFHAGDGTGTPFKWNATGVKATENVAPEYDITKVNGNWYFVLNGEISKIQAPISNGTQTIANPSKEHLSHLGPVWKIVEGEYYIGNTWVCFSQVAAGVIGSFGGNNNSIGIEMSVNTTNDMYDTYQRTAKLVANILIRNNLDLTRVKQHNTWTGKNCPQSIIAGNYWEDFMKMVEIEYVLAKDYKDVEVSIISDNPNIVDNTGRVVNAPSVATTVGYTVKVTSGSTTKTIKLYSVVPGTTSWEQWNGSYVASLIWNKGQFVVNK